MSKSLVAAVVGVGPGIGRSAALKFAKEGYTVALIARSPGKLEPVQKEIEKLNGKAISVPADVSDQKSIEDAFSTIRKLVGNPSVLIYNVAGFVRGSILDLKVDQLDQIFKTTVIGAVLASQQVLPHMKEQKHGTIIFTGATASLRGSALFGGFAFSKFGVRAIAQSMAREFGPQGVHVSHVIIDGGVANVEKSNDNLISPDAVADTYWYLHNQPRTAWTQELDLRPDIEKW